MLPRVTAFPILPEGHLVYKASGGLRIPAKEKTGCPLIGHLAPEIILKDQLGRDCSLHATIELGRPIVLFFFPLAGSPQCTLESCSFRDSLGDSAVFAELDAIVIGISQDTPETLRRFVDEHDLGYIILSDAQREAMQAFGVNKTWLGLINNRCTFVIDHEGIVRGMCEGVLDAKGHNKFAERWLVRIEHELAGRTKKRTVDEDNAVVKTMATEEIAGTKFKHGQENSAKGAGIDQAPRYGAAPAPRVVANGSAKAKKLEKTNGVRNFLAQFSSPDGQPPPVTGAGEILPKQSLTPSTSQDRPSSRRLRDVFRGGRKGTPPPVPPTYENFDDDTRMYGQTDSQGSGSAEPMTASSSAGSHTDHASMKSSGSGSRSTRGTSSSHRVAHSRTASAGSSTKAATYDSIAPIMSIKPKSVDEAPALPAKDFTVLHMRRPQVAETGDLSNGVVTHGMNQLSVQDYGAIPRRSRDAPDDVPMDAIDDDGYDSEEFVTQLANGQIELAPRAQFAEINNGPLPPLAAPSVVQAPPRTTSRATTPSGSNSRPGSSRSMAAPNSSPRSRQSSTRRPSEEDFGRRTTNGRGTPTALGPPPPRSSARATQPQQQQDVSALSRDSLDSMQGAQIQNAKRMVIQKGASSPRRVDSVSSLSTAKPRVVTPRSSPRVDGTPDRHVAIPRQAPVPTHAPPPVPTNGIGFDVNHHAPELGTSPRSVSSVASSSNHSQSSLVLSQQQRRPSEASVASISSMASVGTFGRRPSVAEVMTSL